MAITITPPLAALGDLLENVIPIVFVILYGIAHLVGNMQQEAKKKAAQRPQPVEPPKDFGLAGPAKPAPAANQPTLEETLRREVEEFLRKSQGGQPQLPKQQKTAPRQRQPQRNVGQRQQPRQPRQQPQRQPATRRLVEARSSEPAIETPLVEVQPLTQSTPLGTGVAMHAQPIVEHAQSLGARVALADERMQQRLADKFSHQLGSLATATPTERRAAANAGSMAKELQTMLANPHSVRQLIIAGEILRRPEERWR
jgi:hypothetical protein